MLTTGVQNKMSTLRGILQPTLHRGRDMSQFHFQLMTEKGAYPLEVPWGLEDLFSRHPLEQFVVKGFFVEPNVFHVKAARVERNEAPPEVDAELEFDFNFFKRRAARGPSLEPRPEEMAV